MQCVSAAPSLHIQKFGPARHVIPRNMPVHVDANILMAVAPYDVDSSYTFILLRFPSLMLGGAMYPSLHSLLITNRMSLTAIPMLITQFH